LAISPTNFLAVSSLGAGYLLIKLSVYLWVPSAKYLTLSVTINQGFLPSSRPFNGPSGSLTVSSYLNNSDVCLSSSLFPF